MKNKKKNNLILKIIGSSSILTIASIMVILICILMIFDFFGAELTKEKISNNAEYADLYKQASNKYIKNGYVPLQRLLYFYLEDQSLTFDTLYQLNQNPTGKIEKEISVVCEDERVKNMGACTASNIESNKEYLSVPTPLFNFPLKTSSYKVTSFYNEQRIIYGEQNVHSGWDLATSAQTPLYSVCNGTVHKVTYTQNENIPYDQSGNKTGNIIVLKCDQDYAETYYVTYAHLYPNSAKVKVGDSVSHWTEIASVGTTGHSTGNHLHYQVADANWDLIDGMQLIDFNSVTDYSNQLEYKPPQEALPLPYK